MSTDAFQGLLLGFLGVSVVLAVLLLAGCAASVPVESIPVPHCRVNLIGTGPAKTPCYLPATEAEPARILYRNNSGEIEWFTMVVNERRTP